jgi:predicted protein tyrosine phosphatase
MAKISIQVFGEKELENRIKNNKPIKSHLISIRNPSDNNTSVLSNTISSAFNKVLHLEFNDEQLEKHLSTDGKLPQKNDIERVYRFVKESVQDPHCNGFTVHCWRGISRSTAIAFGIIYMILKDERASADYLKSIRPYATPLPLIVRYWDEILGSKLIDETFSLRNAVFDVLKKKLEQEIKSSI